MMLFLYMYIIVFFGNSKYISLPISLYNYLFKRTYVLSISRFLGHFYIYPLSTALFIYLHDKHSKYLRIFPLKYSNVEQIKSTVG